MASLVVVQDNQVLSRLVVVTVCTVDWSVIEVYNCPHTVLPCWVCSLVTAGKAVLITDGETSCHKQLACHTRGQFLAQFLTQAALHLHISSLTTLAALLHKEDSV